MKCAHPPRQSLRHKIERFPSTCAAETSHKKPLPTRERLRSGTTTCNAIMSQLPKLYDLFDFTGLDFICEHECLLTLLSCYPLRSRFICTSSFVYNLLPEYEALRGSCLIYMPERAKRRCLHCVLECSTVKEGCHLRNCES